MPSSLRRSLALSCLASTLAACTGEEPAPKTYDPDEVIAEAIVLAELERLDLEPVASIHGTMDGFGEIYANEIAAEVFRSIDGSDPTDTAEFPPGSILVKNNLGPDMQPAGVLTVLAKFEDGYSPETKDWFFAVVNGDGETLDGRIGTGVEVYFCYDCHSQMGVNTDLIIGLAPDQLR